ncbi:MAG TPA: arsenate reductase (glutaredoxin) [Polyangiaceae bacterium]|nr:arsenate reductase (glutaredoxin) [Polyangiaceae bacterium]
MLDEKGIAYRYREYTREPLSQAEIKRVLKKLGMTPKDVLRKNDKAYKELGLTGDEKAAELVKLMAEHPTLLQRPIGVVGDKAALGRPVENLLELV